MNWNILHLGITVYALGLSFAFAESWQMQQQQLPTRWGKEVSPTNAHPEYPRPQMVRSDWLNLNGLWDYAITNQPIQPSQWRGLILVPFPVESALSGVMKPIGEAQWLWYRRTFTVPSDWRGRRILLHFGAADWQSIVWVNGRQIGTHRGGYDSFTFDITEALELSGNQEVTVAINNPADAGMQPRGKQTRNVNGTWYSTASGIWQTVWLEPVAAASIEKLQLIPDIDRGFLNINVKIRGEATNLFVQAIAYNQGKEISHAGDAPGRTFKLPIPKAKLWSPDSPFLYNLKLVLLENGRQMDQVISYFGMRKIAVATDSTGGSRIYLNNKPLFQLGPLDHGYWPDGIYTAPTDEALRYDIEIMKQFGFNVCRKHVKVEPDRWYSWCDKLGLLVWQDMPNGAVGEPQTDNSRSEAGARQFEQELRAIIEDRYNHPSIVIWIAFNQNWGQYDTSRITASIKSLDPSRLVISASGWKDYGSGDICSSHNYASIPLPIMERNDSRAVVLGESGGLGLPVAGHDWQTGKKWAERMLDDTNQLNTFYVRLMKIIHRISIRTKLSGVIYTQLTDVEGELNGLMTYDREICKFDKDKVRTAVFELINDSTNEVVPVTDKSMTLNGDPGTSGIWQGGSLDKFDDSGIEQEGDDPGYANSEERPLSSRQLVFAGLAIIVTGGLVIKMRQAPHAQTDSQPDE